ncbi:MAG: hypothetical protein GWO24_01065, partial [Akkermansiaceae bacterium]|nr:hypothetical protein [Akkermansiaceae bacterium]
MDTPEKLPDAVMALALGLALADCGIMRRIKPMLRDRVSEATESVRDVLVKVQEQA